MNLQSKTLFLQLTLTFALGAASIACTGDSKFESNNDKQDRITGVYVCTASCDVAGVSPNTDVEYLSCAIDSTEAESDGIDSCLNIGDLTGVACSPTGDTCTQEPGGDDGGGGGETLCDDGVEVIKLEWVCDEDIDCDDGSDELDCQ